MEALWVLKFLICRESLAGLDNGAKIFGIGFIGSLFVGFGSSCRNHKNQSCYEFNLKDKWSLGAIDNNYYHLNPSLVPKELLDSSLVPNELVDRL